jgi:plastocyanin
MSSRFTASLVVCVAAAGVAVGALALEPGDAPAPAASTPSSSSVTDAAGGGYGSADGGTAGGTGNGATVAIRDFTFAASIAAPGAAVTVANADGVPHTVTATGGEFDSGDVPGGGAGTFQAPDASGTYEFFCEIHPGMTGTLTVG